VEPALSPEPAPRDLFSVELDVLPATALPDPQLEGDPAPDVLIRAGCALVLEPAALACAPQWVAADPGPFAETVIGWSAIDPGGGLGVASAETAAAVANESTATRETAIAAGLNIVSFLRYSGLRPTKP
jgi:hypothetical protein